MSSSLVCVLAQRLVRVICPHCKESYSPSRLETEYLGIEPPPSLLYRGKGCDRCLGKGYFGRTGIYELLEISPQIRPMIAERKDAQAIRAAAIENGFKTMQKNAIEKVLQGVTTIEEVLRVTQKDAEV